MRTRATVPAGVWTSPYGRSDIRPPSRLEIKNTYAEGLRRLLRWWVQFGARSCEGAAPAMPMVDDKVGGMGASPSRRSLLLGLFRWRWERGGLAVGLGVLLRSLVLLGHVDVLDQRRVVEDLAEPFVFSAAGLPPGDDHRGHGVANQVGDRSGLGHEAVDADDEGDAHRGDVAEGLQPGGQGHQAGPGDPGCAL